ncbi:MAG: hypothetical protein IJE68_01895 [Clostridia bacterium]|nr:hypothetical protein [Clostridia bacterium]
MLELLKSKEWEIEQSSLAKISKDEISYEQCRSFACEDISRSLTHLGDDLPFIVEIPENTEFHFIGRVDTTFGNNTSSPYYKSFEDRTFISFTTINNRNISRYKGRIFFAYNIIPEDIVHIFPMDSDTSTDANCEEDLTPLPSLWLTLRELEDLTAELGVYNQITCNTKRYGQILKPFAIIAFNELDEYTQKVAKEFGISCIIVHPDKEAIQYDKDLLHDYFQLKYVSSKMKEKYDLEDSRYLFDY